MTSKGNNLWGVIMAGGGGTRLVIEVTNLGDPTQWRMATSRKAANRRPQGRECVGEGCETDFIKSILRNSLGREKTEETSSLPLLDFYGEVMDCYRP